MTDCEEESELKVVVALRWLVVMVLLEDDCEGRSDVVHCPPTPVFTPASAICQGKSCQLVVNFPIS